MPEPRFDESLVADVPEPPRRAAASRRADGLLLLIALAGVAAIAAYAWWSWNGPHRTAEAPASVAPPAAAPAPAASAVASAPAVRYPVEAPASAPALPALDESDLELARLLEGPMGREGMAQLRMSGFVRNVVATVDNLARTHASAHAWPVVPTSGHFSLAENAGRTVIGPDNELRYAPFVLAVESADLPALVRLYRATYPLFQQAYEELGYPGRHFNDRLVEVIDHLLAAPEPAGPAEVEPVRVEGSTPLARPWQHHVFVDPQLESLSAGQKILVRVGPVNERRLKARLRELRSALVASPAAAP